MKVVLNKDYGGFGLSNEAYKLYFKKKNIPVVVYFHDWKNGRYIREDKLTNDDLGVLNSYCYAREDFGEVLESHSEYCHDFCESCIDTDEIKRHDPVLVEVVEELSDSANDSFAHLKIIEIPDDLTDYEIDSYDGFETLHQRVERY